MYVCMYVCMYIYIYIYREGERDIDMCLRVRAQHRHRFYDHRLPYINLFNIVYYTYCYNS